MALTLEIKQAQHLPALVGMPVAMPHSLLLLQSTLCQQD